MANNFQKIVLTVAIIIFIILLLFIGSVLYNEKRNSSFPPVVSSCPDFWLDREITTQTSIDGNNSSETTGKCYNNHNLGNPSCSKEMDFTGDFWTGTDGTCNKYKWAKGCDLTWDGITNNSDSCS